MLFLLLISVDMFSKKLIFNYLKQLKEHINTIQYFQQLNQYLLSLHQEFTNVNEYKQFSVVFAFLLINLINRIIMSVKNWNNVDMINKLQKLLERDQNVIWKIIENWRKQILLIIHEKFDKLWKFKKIIYFNKIFFSDKTIKIINISSNEKLEINTFKSEFELKFLKKSKRKKMKNEDK